MRYVPEGSVQKSGDRVRVIAQLADAINGHHLLAEHYDWDMQDFFAIQDDITKEVVVALQVKLTEGKHARIWHETENIEIWSYAMEEINLFQLYTKEEKA